MSIFTKTVSLIAILLLLFLSWPDFGVDYDYDCSRTSPLFISNGGECPVTTKAVFKDVKFGGGWRWVQNNFCVQDGTIMLFSDTCQSNSLDEARVLKFAFLGSMLTTAGVGLVIFRKPIAAKFRKKSA